MTRADRWSYVAGLCCIELCCVVQSCAIVEKLAKLFSGPLLEQTMKKPAKTRASGPNWPNCIHVWAPGLTSCQFQQLLLPLLCHFTPAGTVKGLTSEQMQELDCHVILGNTYHLANR